MQSANGNGCAARPSSDRVPHEESILENLRQHLRNARRQGLTGSMTFSFKRGGIARKSLKLVVEYDYLDETDKLASMAD